MRPTQVQRIRIDDLLPTQPLTGEELASVFGAGIRNARLGLEALESRELMASKVTATLAAGVIRVEGTSNADRIVIQQVGQTLRVQGVAITNPAGKTVAPPLARVDSIRIDALGGDDAVWIKGNLPVRVDVNAGSGADLILAGSKTSLTRTFDSADRLVSTDAAALWKRLETARLVAGGRYALNSVKLGSVMLTGVSAAITASGLSLTGMATLPAVGKVRLTGNVSADNTSYNLAASLGDRTVGGFRLSNTAVKLDNRGLSLTGDASLAVFGKVNFTGTLTGGGYALTANLGSRSLLGGLVRVSSAKLTLTAQGVTVDMQATAGQIASANFKGSISANGSYSIKANASITVAGFKVDGARLTLGSDEVDVKFRMPVASVGNVEFGGSYGPGGKWSLTGTYPGVVTIGPVVLKRISLTLTNNSLTLSALGTIASVEGIVDARATATLYSNGCFDMKVDARALSVAGFSVGQAVVTVSNNNSRRDVITTIRGIVGIPSGPNVTLNGVVDSRGNYTLTGTQSVQVAGLTLSQATFTLKKGEGLTFSGTWNNFGYSVKVTGSVSPGGRVLFQGTGGTARLPNGFSLGSVTVSADLNRATNSYRLRVEGQADVKIASLKFTGTTSRIGSTWQTPVLTGSGRVGGALAKLFSGDARFTMQSNQANFEGRLALRNISGVSYYVRGAVKSDGTLTIGNYSVSTNDLLRGTMASLGKALRGAGAGFYNIALGIAANYSVYLSDIAKALRGAGASFGSVADALWNSRVRNYFPGGFTIGTLGQALGAAGASFRDVAVAVAGNIGGLHLSDIARAVRGAGASFASTAKALWSTSVERYFPKGFDMGDLGAALGGAGAGYRDVALAVLGGIGNLTLTDVADAVRGAGASFASVASALWSNSVESYFSGGFDMGDLGEALGGIGASYRSVALAVLDGIGGLTLTDVADAVRGAGASFASVAKALWSTSVESHFSGGFDMGDLGLALGGAGASYRSVALAVLGGIGGLSLSDVARAVRGAGASFNSVAAALWSTSVENYFSGGFNDYDLGYALWNAGAGSGSVISALQSIGTSYARALAIWNWI